MATTTRTRRQLPEILRTLRTSFPDLQERYGVRSLGVFGSYARGEQRPDSDLDVLVEFDDRSVEERPDVDQLRRELSKALGLKVDLGERKQLKPYIGRMILDEVIDVLGADAPRLIRGHTTRVAEQRREWRDYLRDILDNIERAEEFTQGVLFEAFSADTQRVYATLHALLIIGEAAGKIPTAVRRDHPELPWRRIVGLRNIVAHAYFNVNLAEIWRITTEDLPALRETALNMWREQERTFES